MRGSLSLQVGVPLGDLANEQTHNPEVPFSSRATCKQLAFPTLSDLCVILNHAFPSLFSLFPSFPPANKQSARLHFPKNSKASDDVRAL
uniref:Ovule protein n=1 Tax=Steinernema glaseri TaxID=37863 RepID=A0A1I7Y425_9BILA